MNKFQKTINQCAKDDMKKSFLCNIYTFREKRMFWRKAMKNISFEVIVELKNENKLLPF